MCDARFELTVDVVFRDQRFDQCFGVFGQVPHPHCIFLPDKRFERVLFHALAAAQLTAVTPRGTKASAMCIQKHHINALLRQMQRARQPRVARADDAHVCRGLPAQCRAQRRLRDC